MSWHPRRIGDEVKSELARFGPAGAMGEVVAAWPAAVGEAIAANAWPARCARDGTLHVATASSVWAFELTQLEATIRARLSEHLSDGAPPRLRFAVGRLPEPRTAEVEIAKRTVPEVSAEMREAAARIAAGIEDEELRELVARAAAASLARKRG
jgi:predicted nucleic acid-binding Zn ribbon protein